MKSGMHWLSLIHIYKLTRSEAVAIINRITDRKMTTEILEKLTCPFSDVSETHWAYNDILLAACEY